MSTIKGTNVIAPVVPFSTTDTHATHEARYGRGGYRTAATTAERDAIPALRREAGMLVYVVDADTVYQLGVDLVTWSELHLGGTSLPSGADGYVLTSDARLSDSREWFAATVTQTEAEAGTATSRVAWTVQRVWQAVAAWWASSAAKVKLDGIATNATANATDAQLRDRATHTGTQSAATITGLAGVATSGSYADLTNKPTTLSGYGITDAVLLSDSRMSNARTPTSHASSHATGGTDAITPSSIGAATTSHSHSADAITSGTIASARLGSGTASVSTFLRGDGTWASAGSTSASDLTSGTISDSRLSANVVLTGDSRLADARTPTAHAASHATGGTDAITPSSIGAAASSHNHAASDITSGTIATARLGSGTASSSTFLRGDGTWASAGSTSASDLTSGTLNDARLSANVVLTGDSRLSDNRAPTDGSVTDAKIASGGLSTSSLNWAAIQPWAANTAYAKGDLVSNAGIAYRRSAAGTSGSTFNSANWQQITPSTFVAGQITSGTLDDARLSFVPLHPFLLMGG